MPAPIILVFAPVVSGWVAAGFTALVGLVATPTCIGINHLINKLGEPSDRQLSEEERLSLARQNALLQERETAAVTIADNTLQSAAQAAEERDVLMEEQRTAALLLLDATQEETRAASTLTALSASSYNRDAAFKTEMVEQVTQLADAVQGVPASMDLLSRELGEKQLMIDSLRLKLEAMQAESAKREAILQQILSQVTELASLNQEQATTIEKLQRQKATLLNNMNALTEELEFLNSRPIEQAQLTTTTPSPTFFR